MPYIHVYVININMYICLHILRSFTHFKTVQFVFLTNVTITATKDKYTNLKLIHNIL